MALYEPTNISPDLKYSVGNGTVDVNYGLTIAWQVNGNAMTPMNGYQITIRENNAAGTLVYKTPIERLNEPFFGADALGNPIRYEIDLPAENVLSGHYFGYRSDSITDVSVDFDAFTSKLSEYNLYQFVYTGTFWRFMGGQESSLADYGITYTGTPAAQDVISVVLGAPMVNGREYKMEIAQSWSYGSSGGAGMVLQKSPSVFITRSKPELTLDAFSAPVTSRAKTFTASYQQAQYDPLSWVRWRIALSDDLDNPLYDSGRIYGAGVLETTYDGFFSGSTYAIRCDGETINGVVADTGWLVFPVSYTMYPSSAALSASCSTTRNAVRLSWGGAGGVYYFPATLTGCSFDMDQLVLSDANASAEWYRKIEGTPWSLIYSATAVNSGGAAYNDILRVDGMASGRIIAIQKTTAGISVAYFDRGSEELVVVATGTYLGNPLSVYIRPSEDAAYPASDYVQIDVIELRKKQPPQQHKVCTGFVSGQQSSISPIVISGKQRCLYIQTFRDVENNALTQWLAEGNPITQYSARRDSATVMMTQWHLGRETANAGTIDTDPANGTMTIYREKNGSLRRVAEPPLDANGVWDYSLGNRQGPVVYYAFPGSLDANWNAPLVSPSVNPCLWVWTLLSCVEESENVYRVEREFHFGNNLSTGAISNNNTPSLWNNFTRYPTMQRAPQNYQSGSLTALIGVIEGGEYTDTIEARNAIWALSTTQNTLFLKSRKGDVLMVAISDAITMQTGDNTPQQTQTATIPWVEIGSADGVQIYSLS